MSSISLPRNFLGGALLALAGFSLPSMSTAQSTETAPVSAPTVVAQAPGPVAAADNAVPFDEFPAYQRGVRQAAKEGPDALRRYVSRTRMIYNFRYNDFAPKE